MGAYVGYVGTPDQRFDRKVNIAGPIPSRRPDLGPCHLWTGRDNGQGYGRLYVGGKIVYTHRYAAERAFGEIPEEQEVDHLCGVRHCVNPDHLEIVTGEENKLRTRNVKSHCRHGHLLTPGNLYFRHDGYRQCRTCTLDRQKLSRRGACHEV